MRPEATSVCGLKLLATLQEKCKELLAVLPHLSGSKGTGLRIGLFATFVGLGPPELKAATRRNLQAGFFGGGSFLGTLWHFCCGENQAVAVQVPFSQKRQNCLGYQEG